MYKKPEPQLNETACRKLVEWGVESEVQRIPRGQNPTRKVTQLYAHQMSFTKAVYFCKHLQVISRNRQVWRIFFLAQASSLSASNRQAGSLS